MLLYLIYTYQFYCSPVILSGVYLINVLNLIIVGTLLHVVYQIEQN